jgi:hypothetical protein
LATLSIGSGGRVQQPVVSQVFRIVGIFVFLFASEAVASDVCMPFNEMEASLIDWYDERPVQEIISNVVLWKSERGETWTVVKYNPDGTACTLQHGTNLDGSVSLTPMNVQKDQ